MSGDSTITLPVVYPNGAGGHRPEVVPVDREGNVVGVGGVEWGASIALSTTSPVVVQAAGGSGLKRKLLSIQAINTGAAATELIILDGVTERWRLSLPVNVPVSFALRSPLVATANAALNASLSVAGTVRVNFQGVTAP